MQEAFAALEEELVRWGVLERGAALGLTRRFRAAFARAAATLQATEAGAAAPPDGVEAMRRAAALALQEFSLPAGAAPRPAHARFVVGVEIAALPPAVREALGVRGV